MKEQSSGETHTQAPCVKVLFQWILHNSKYFRFEYASRDKKLPILTQIGGFRTVTPVWIYQWLRNDAQSLK